MTKSAAVAEQGRSVTIRYSVILENGSRVSDEKTKPLTFKIGSKRVFPSLESGIAGMKPGETRQITITPEQGYGHYNSELVIKVEKKMFPPDMKLVPGKTVQYQNRDGERANFVVQQVDEETVVLDGNHPLAGQKLEYQVELLGVA
ncbi:FKBP-type peptidyl-prolyl cis-trans isomerase [Desulforhopalus singaporensis]|uniref:Peptidyl-prolyl cis-trans isomerase n=1 Tax=Desulforhopalus singaporensis TaxID=91360 RepID=A0A1H0IWD6_9BACT|nr:FKBP-type peptidyl-prolyl cis-trans isomerase [Desulforhopalus singaporensis]SDO35757.1 peptidylprolyl isomerase [Desulforhopalus singaporensis]